MSNFILHHYDASPFTQKALRMLGIKGLPWKSVITPMMPPKDDLVALTGGYRGTPVLQIGSDVYVDSQLIAIELERRFPEPTLFPGANLGIALMLVKWSDVFFRAGLAIIIEQTSAQWPEPFLADRKKLFHDIDWERACKDSSHARSQFRAHVGLLNVQLSDGRAFLGGAAPGLADVQAHVFIAMMLGQVPAHAEALLKGFNAVRAWHERMLLIGEGGQRTEITADEAFRAARENPPALKVDIDPDDALALAARSRIRITPDDTGRGAVEGELLKLKWNEVAVARSHERCGTVIVHFPRLGYRIEPT